MNELNKISISWGDGTDQHFYLDFSQVSENDVVLVTSDPNYSGTQRVKVIGFKGISEQVYNNQPVAYLKVLQQTDNSVVASFDNSVSIYSDIKASFEYKS